MLRKLPLIVILGSTGTGKTKLSIELAQRFGGEIISADSMQVYANLDVATAKATKDEQTRARHHLLDVAQPSEPFTVVHFRNAALPIIDDLLSQQKCPIVVGGTNYYIESLLWDILVANSSPPPPPPPGSVATKSDAISSGDDFDYAKMLSSLDLNTMPSESLYAHLRHIDAVTAARIHPNNKRKIMRALEVFTQTGVKLSAILEEQRSQPGGNRLGGPLRYEHTILLWLKCNQEVLNTRLDKRVDGMLKEGLLPEVRNFYDTHCGSSNSETEYTKGVLQTIGFKEFIPYLERYDSSHDRIIEKYLATNAYKIPAQFDESHPEGLNVLTSCLEELKLVTKRYSKKQIKWINNRFLASKDRQVPPLYSLDTSDVAKWGENVYLPAVDVVQSYMADGSAKLEPMAKLQHPGVGLNEEVSNFCTTCNRHFVGEYQWHLHMKSNKHKKRKEGERKRKANNERQTNDEEENPKKSANEEENSK